MTKLEPTDLCPDWVGQTTLQRVLTCAAMLHIHDFLTDKERQMVQKRVTKWLARQSARDGLGKTRAKKLAPLRLVHMNRKGKIATDRARR